MLFGRKWKRDTVLLVAAGAIAGSCLVAFDAFFTALPGAASKGGLHDVVGTWMAAGSLKIDLALRLDALSGLLCLIITFVGFLIHIYSSGYMEHDPDYARFFAYLNLFCGAMLVLVLGDSLPVMFIGWEGVGLCSYLLIGFWYTSNANADAGKKAFITNRIGDLGFLIGMFLLYQYTGSLNFRDITAAATSGGPLLQPLWGATAAFWAALFLFVGATGKSAQIPLYVWLPDAMAGPTPVSALIHAATMVTAGVYMTARSWVVFTHAPVAMEWVACIGIVTAFFAASIGLVQNDIKKVFAYSTVSQLCYMFVGVGCGAFSAGIYHLMTHAFFKALLFLGSGSVIHALSGEQDMRNMGGLRTKIPWTFGSMMCAAVAIAGIPPFSGFFSKDAILLAAHQHAPWMYWLGVVTAGMTAFYVFRAMFMTFFGEYRGHEHPHESPPSMLIPLVILAVLSLGGGYLFKIPDFLSALFPAMEVPEDLSLMLISVAAGVAGIAVAWLMYVSRPGMADSLAAAFKLPYQLIYNKWFVDEIYDAAVVKPLVGGSRLILWKGVDAGLIDGAVNGVGSRARDIGGILRLMQSGNVRSYACWVLLGSVLLIWAMGFGGGLR